ncbi:MAG: hypothetical protein WD431_12955 [Cyclobacteriaceae bacterium]
MEVKLLKERLGPEGCFGTKTRKKTKTPIRLRHVLTVFALLLIYSGAKGQSPDINDNNVNIAAQEMPSNGQQINFAEN